jgi:hypothetical protein
MNPKLSDPLDPNQFGNVFAELLAIITDGRDVDCVFGTNTFDAVVTVGGIDYRVRITPAALVEDAR